MRAENINWHPVRLGLTRLNRGLWAIQRCGKDVGFVRCERGEWAWVRAMGNPNSPEPPDRIGGWVQRRSFLASVLAVSRLSGVFPASRGPQDFGAVRMLRVCVSGSWYTVIITDKGDRFVYEDFSIPDKLNDWQQALLRLVSVEVDKYLDQATPMV